MQIEVTQYERRPHEVLTNIGQLSNYFPYAGININEIDGRTFMKETNTYDFVRKIQVNVTDQAGEN